MDLARKADQEIVRGFAAKWVTCPYTGTVLDKKTTVVVSAEGCADVVCHEDHWERVKDTVAAGAKARGIKITILDGRELFKK